MTNKQYALPKTMEECLELQSHFIGIPRITAKTKQEFYRRGKTLQILGVGFLDKGRMPTLEEVESHMDLETTASRLDTKKWNSVLVSILNDMTSKIVTMEEEQIIGKLERVDKDDSGNINSNSC